MRRTNSMMKVLQMIHSNMNIIWICMVKTKEEIQLSDSPKWASNSTKVLVSVVKRVDIFARPQPRLQVDRFTPTTKSMQQKNITILSRVVSF